MCDSLEIMNVTRGWSNRRQIHIWP